MAHAVHLIGTDHRLVMKAMMKLLSTIFWYLISVRMSLYHWWKSRSFSDGDVRSTPHLTISLISSRRIF